MADKYMNDVPSGKGKSDQNLGGTADIMRGNKMGEKSTYNGEVKPQQNGQQPKKDGKPTGDGDGD